MMKTEVIAIDDLKQHPRNYRGHPDDQIEHIKASLKEHGLYRNVVVAKDNTILAGHGVVRAAEELGERSITVHRMDIDPCSAQALKLLAGDNEIANLAGLDDPMLAEILKELAESDNLLGTGFDHEKLANYLAVIDTSNLAGKDDSDEWVGMPDYENMESEQPFRIVISCQSREDREELIRKLGLKIYKPAGEDRAWSAWWPAIESDDPKSVRFESAKE